MSYFFGWGDDVEVTIIDPAARVRSSRRVTMGGPLSLHDCAITERSVVLMDLPVTFSLDALGEGASFPYRWQEGYHSRVGLLPRDSDSTEVVWHDVEPCYVFHVLNAYDEPGGDGVVLDVVRHPSMFRTHLLGPERGGAPTARSAGISMGTAAPSRRSASTIAGRSSPASTSASSAGRTATATPWPSPSPTTSSRRSQRWSATTSSAAPRSSASLRARRRRGVRPCSFRAPTTPRRPTAGFARPGLLSPDSGTSAPVPHHQRCRPGGRGAGDRRAPPSASPPASTATGSPTPPEPLSWARLPIAAPGVGFRRDPLALGPAAPAAIGPDPGLRDRQLRWRDGVGPRLPHRVVARRPARGAAHVPARTDREDADDAARPPAQLRRLHLSHDRGRA